MQKESKYIFVVGGIMSSIGKGMCASSLGSLLEASGYRISLQKIDPYLNIDAGNMSPDQHGEVFVTDDGLETDLDLGNYERFTQMNTSKLHSVTAGQIYLELLQNERDKKYLGKTIQVIPHITDMIQLRFTSIEDSYKDKSKMPDFFIIELGGTVGDMECIPFLEAIRQFSNRLGKHRVAFVYLTWIPTINGGELKTKLAQHSIREVNQLGLHVDILVCRTKRTLPTAIKQKLEYLTGIAKDNIISSIDYEVSRYELPYIYYQENLIQSVLKYFGLPAELPEEKLSSWKRISDYSKNTQLSQFPVYMIGKYLESYDSYTSIFESLEHAAFQLGIKLNVILLDAEKEKPEDYPDMKGIIIPGGFGVRGTEGMIQWIRYARTQQIPFFGICFGMQLMAIEFIRHVANIPEATSLEFYPESPYGVIAPTKIRLKAGQSMRLGGVEISTLEGSLLREVYQKESIRERHRHLYEIAESFKSYFQGDSLCQVSGYMETTDTIEALEWKDHPFGVAVQYHPEYISRPFAAHPLFVHFLKAILLENEKNKSSLSKKHG